YIEEPKFCERMTAWYFEGITIAPSPKWMQKILIECGMRPISNVVDITNYVTLETGQPLHAFDFDKMEGGKLIVRRAKNGENLELLDGTRLRLDSRAVVLADVHDALDLGGVKGGKKAEITKETKRVLLTAGNFDSVAIYKASRRFNVSTDASVRFSHGLSEVLPQFGLERGAQLLFELMGALPGKRFDSRVRPFARHIIEFNMDWLNHFLGVDFDRTNVAALLRRLDFKNVGGDRWEVPLIRPDIQTREDVAEEVVRLTGYNIIKPKPPRFNITPSLQDDVIFFKDKVRNSLLNFGVDEIYNHSFISEEDYVRFGFRNVAVELENPVSQEFKYLRPTLASALLENVNHNAKFFQEFKVFEIGKIFSYKGRKVNEQPSLGVIVASKEKETLFNLKGIISHLLKSLGLVDFVFVPAPQNKDGLVSNFTKTYLQPASVLTIESSNKTVGYFGKSTYVPKGWYVSLFEVNLSVLLELVEGEEEYRPLPKYPAVMRDMSLLVDQDIPIGDIMQEIELSNKKLIEDVDLVDEYIDPRWIGKQSLSFRIVFQSDTRTLTSEEVDREIKKVGDLLRHKFNAEIR
ncbi:phenylalanine--tRNA ligase subunit beta, partial [Candidatus Jorgensenbacteria bacterium]|nr:phenylalanine--tRNA ligase subunit beta [Candidatus Jorgensenbacteria bacterium]